MTTGTSQTQTQADSTPSVVRTVLTMVLVPVVVGAMLLFLLVIFQNGINKNNARISEATSDNAPPYRFSAFDNAPLNPSANSSDRMAVAALKDRLSTQLLRLFLFIFLIFFVLIAVSVSISRLIRISLVRKEQPLPEVNYNKSARVTYLLLWIPLLAGTLLWAYVFFIRLPATEDETFCAGLLWPECQRLYGFPGTGVANELMLAQGGIALMIVSAVVYAVWLFIKAAQGKIP